MRHTLLLHLLLCGIHRITHSQSQPRPQSAPTTEWVDATGTIDVYHCTPRADADMGSAAYRTLCPELWATLGDGRRVRAWAEDPQSERWTAHEVEAVEIPLHGHMNRDGDLVLATEPARCHDRPNDRHRRRRDRGGDSDESSDSRDGSGDSRDDATVAAAGLAGSTAGHREQPQPPPAAASADEVGRMCRIGADAPRWFPGGTAEAERVGWDRHTDAIAAAQAHLEAEKQQHQQSQRRQQQQQQSNGQQQSQWRQRQQPQQQQPNGQQQQAEHQQQQDTQSTASVSDSDGHPHHAARRRLTKSYNTGNSTMLFMLCEWSDKTFGDKNDTEYIKLWKDKVRFSRKEWT